MSRKKRFQATGGNCAHQCDDCIPPDEPIHLLQRGTAHGPNNSTMMPRINSILHAGTGLQSSPSPAASSGLGCMRGSVPDLRRARRSDVFPASVYGYPSAINGLHSEPPRSLNRVLGTGDVNGSGHNVAYGVPPHLMQQPPWRASEMLSSNGGPGAFQGNHTGPNMQPCQDEPSFYSRSSQSLPVLILWDVENVQMPKKVSVAHAVHAVRAYVQRAVAGRPWFETDFAVACDVFRQQTRRVAEMNNAQITVIHVNSMSKNAADMKLKVYMHKFATMFSQQSACVVLISGDVNFAPSLHLARHHAKLQVVLLHNQLTPSTLLETAHFADDFYRVVMTTPWLEGPASVWAGGACLPAPQHQPGRQSTHLLVANLPEDSDAARITRRLHKMSTNTGGRVVEVRGSLALMRFPSAQNATRALARMDERDVCGQRVRVHFVDDPVSRGNHKSALSSLPNAEASSSSASVSARREPCSGAETVHSNTSSDSASTPCILDSHEAGNSSRNSTCDPCSLEGRINAAFDTSCTTEVFGPRVSSPCGTYSSDSQDESSCSSQLGLNMHDPQEDEEVGCTCSRNGNTQDAQGRRSILGYLLVAPDRCDEPLQNLLYSSPIKLSGADSTSRQDVCRSPPCTGRTQEEDLVMRTGESGSGSSMLSQLASDKHPRCVIHNDRLVNIVDAAEERNSFDRRETFNSKETAENDLLELRAKCLQRHEPEATSTLNQSNIGGSSSVCSGSPWLTREVQPKDGRAFEKDKVGKTGCRPATGKRSKKRVLYLRHHTHLEKSLMTLVYFVHEILNESTSFSVRGDDDDFVVGEPESRVLPLDVMFFEDLQQMAAGCIPQSERTFALLENIGASLVATLTGRVHSVAGCVGAPFSIKAYSGQGVATAEKAKRFLRTTSNDSRLIALPNALEDLPVARRVNSLQEILQETASMLLATRYGDVHESAKALTSLGMKPREEFVQRWISQLVHGPKKVTTLDPFRALQRCRKLPKTVHEPTVEATDRNWPRFSLTQATNYGGPDVAPVLAIFVTSPSPLSVNELETRFLKKRGRALPLPAVHLLHELGAIEMLSPEPAENHSDYPVTFDVKGVCAIVRSLIHQMNRAPDAIYHLPSSFGSNGSGYPSHCFADKYSITYLLKTSGMSQLTDSDVAKVLDDFGDLFEKLSSSGDTDSIRRCRNSYRLRQCVVAPKRTCGKKTTTTNRERNRLAEENFPSTQACQDKPLPQMPMSSQGSGSNEDQRPTPKGRRSLRLAAIFP